MADDIDPTAGMGNKDFLAAELSPDGKEVRCTWPDDPLLAERLMIELDYQFKKARVEGAMTIRAMASDQAQRRVELGDPNLLRQADGLNARHRKS